MNIGIRPLIFAVFLLVGVPAIAFGAEPSAIVEDVAAGPAGVQPMDFVERGRVLKLGQGGRIVLGYLSSCERETIVSGVVTVGEARSEVKGGTVTRERVECDSGQLHLSAEQSGKSGVLVMRNPPDGQKSAAAPVQRIFSTSPVIIVSSGAATLSIIRVDGKSAPLRLDAPGGKIDLAKQGISLELGAIYRAEAGARSVLFSVSAFANPAPGPLVGRLIRL